MKLPWQPGTAGITSVLPYTAVMLLHAFADVCSIYTNNAHAPVKKNQVDLTYDGSSQLQFHLIQAQTIAYLTAFGMLSAQGSIKGWYSSNTWILLILNIYISPANNAWIQQIFTLCLVQIRESTIIARVPPLLWHKHAIAECCMHRVFIVHEYCIIGRPDACNSNSIITIYGNAEHCLYMFLCNFM